MKKEWCVNFDCGKCKAGLSDVKPSLMVEYVKKKGVIYRDEVITDHMRIVSFLSFQDPEVLNSGNIPKQITLSWPETQLETIYKCSASNSRSAQNKCDGNPEHRP